MIRKAVERGRRPTSSRESSTAQTPNTPDRDRRQHTAPIEAGAPPAGRSPLGPAGTHAGQPASTPGSVGMASTLARNRRRIVDGAASSIEVLVEGLGRPVVSRDVMSLPALLVEPQPPPAPRLEVVLPPHPQDPLTRAKL